MPKDEDILQLVSLLGGCWGQSWFQSWVSCCGFPELSWPHQTCSYPAGDTWGQGPTSIPGSS